MNKINEDKVGTYLRTILHLSYISYIYFVTSYNLFQSIL